MATLSKLTLYRNNPKKRNKGIHSKKKQSKSKTSKNYFKVNIGQGK